MDLFDRIMELSRCGYFCGQILAILLLETLGEENPGFVRAMGGLNGGVGFSGDVCGCMSGGACVISYLTGKGEDPARIQALMKEVMAANEKVLAEPAPFAQVSGGTNEAMEFTARAWCATGDYWDVYFALIQGIVEKLGENNVQAPAVRVITDK